MAERWMTNAHTPGRYAVCRLREGFVKDGVPPKGTPIEEYGDPIPRCTHKRHCQECGKEVCTYKDSHMETVWCYTHDHLTPWTRPYLVGPGGVARNQWTPCYNEEDGEESYG